MKDNMRKVLAGLMVALMLLSGSAMFALAEGDTGTPATTEGQPTQTVDTTVPAEAAPQLPMAMHIVTLFDADGFLFMSRPIEDGKVMPKPQDGPAPEGYRFLYWYDARDLEMKEFLFEETPVTENLELWAFVEFIPVEEPIIEEEPVEELPGDIVTDGVENTDGTGDTTTDTTNDGVLVDNGDGSGIVIIEDNKTDGDTTTEPTTEEPDTEEPVVERKVIIRSNIGAIVRPGDTITLMAELVGFDGLEYTLQWQSNDGTGWVDVEGATEINYSYVVDSTNIDNGWRLLVTVAEVEAEEVADEDVDTDVVDVTAEDTSATPEA